MLEKYYKILGLSIEASDEDIKKAYRKLAMEFHPDRNNDKSAKMCFLEISEAYNVLSNKEELLNSTRINSFYDEVVDEARRKANEEANMKYAKLRKKQKALQARISGRVLVILAAVMIGIPPVTIQINEWYMDYMISQNPGEAWCTIVKTDAYQPTDQSFSAANVVYTFSTPKTTIMNSIPCDDLENCTVGDNGLPLRNSYKFKILYNKEHPQYNRIDFGTPDDNTLQSIKYRVALQLIDFYEDQYNVDEDQLLEFCQCVTDHVYTDKGLEGLISLIFMDAGWFDDWYNDRASSTSILEEESFKQKRVTCMEEATRSKEYEEGY